MNLRAGIVTVGLFAVLSACALVDFRDPGGSHCRFAGIESACGRCVADRCGAVVDGCCFDVQCGGVIADVEACAAQSGASCTHLADRNDRGGLHADLSTCFAKECASICPAAPPPPS